MYQCFFIYWKFMQCDYMFIECTIIIQTFISKRKCIFKEWILTDERCTLLQNFIRTTSNKNKVICKMVIENQRLLISMRCWQYQFIHKSIMWKFQFEKSRFWKFLQLVMKAICSDKLQKRHQVIFLKVQFIIPKVIICLFYLHIIYIFLHWNWLRKMQG